MKCLLLLPLFLLIVIFSYSQDSNAVKSPAIGTAISFYNKYIGENSSLFNGSEYVAYDFRIRGHQYFEWRALQKGTVNYDNTLYEGVNIGYDIARDELITYRYNDNLRIQLVSEKISYFSWPGHFFVRLLQDSSSKPLITTGFYERLYNGNIKLFAKRTKKVLELVTADGDDLWFKESNAYFVKKNDQYFSVQTKSQLYELISDRKKDVKRYLRKNKIKFRKDPETTILTAIKYYDQLKN
jgi:hypothetical protein